MPQQSLFTLRDFLASSTKYNFARSNRFEIQIHSPEAITNKWRDSIRRINVMIEDTALPGRTLNTAQLRINGLFEQRARSIDFFGEAINFTFYIDDTWDVKEFFQDWQKLIIDPESREVGYYNQYIGSVDMNVLSLDDTIAHSVQLQEAFPRSFQLIQTTQGSNAVQRFVVAFAFKKWVEIPVDGTRNPSPSAVQEQNQTLTQQINTKIQSAVNALPNIVRTVESSTLTLPEPLNTIGRILGQ